MALLLPLILLLVAIAFTGWSALQQTISLTSAARAGAIKAANDLAQAGQGPGTCPVGSGATATAWQDATNAINSEEGTSVYQCSNSGADDYVTLTTTTDSLNGTLSTPMSLVTITLSHNVGAWIPVVSNLHVTATATGRYG